MPRATEAQLALVEAYVRTGSHKCAARRLRMTEDAYRARTDRLRRHFGANGMAQLVYMVRDQLPADLTAASAGLDG
jgi:hypothetical protein